MLHILTNGSRAILLRLRRLEHTYVVAFAVCSLHTEHNYINEFGPTEKSVFIQVVNKQTFRHIGHNFLSSEIINSQRAHPIIHPAIKPKRNVKIIPMNPLTFVTISRATSLLQSATLLFPSRPNVHWQLRFVHLLLWLHHWWW